MTVLTPNLVLILFFVVWFPQDLQKYYLSHKTVSRLRPNDSSQQRLGSPCAVLYLALIPTFFNSPGALPILLPNPPYFYHFNITISFIAYSKRFIATLLSPSVSRSWSINGGDDVCFKSFITCSDTLIL